MQPPERLLTGPGPSNPHPKVTEALAAPLVGHLDPFFLQVMDETMDNLRTVFGTTNHHTIPMSATGSGGLETIMLNLLEPGDDAVVGVIGYFGQRLAAMASKAGATVRTLEEDLGQIIDPGRLEAELQKKPAKLVALVHAETSTGTESDVKTLTEIAHANDCLVIVDAVTSLGGIPLLVDEWKLDAVYSGTQKCLSCVPGLSPVTFGANAIAKSGNVPD